MTKKTLPIVLFFSILTTACGILFDKSDQASNPVQASTESVKSEETDQDNQIPTPEPLTNAENPCILFNVLDMTLVNLYPDLPPVEQGEYTVGPEDAFLTFIEYSEPQCPYCAQLEPILVEFQKKYPDDVRLVFRFRPFQESFHDKSILGSQAMVAAGIQGKFIEFKNFLFERQYQDPNDPNESQAPASDFWSGLQPDAFIDWLRVQTPALGIDANQLISDIYSEEVVAKVKSFQEEADQLGIKGTPYLFINGYEWPETSRDIGVFSVYLRLLKNRANELSACPQQVIEEGKNYTANISTTKGDIEVELYPEKAPVAVNSFVFLAEQGLYDNLPVQASDEIFLSGDPSDTLYGSFGYVYLNEPSDLTFSTPGMLATREIFPGYGTNGSMFFINKTSIEKSSQTIFGKVTKGLDVLNEIENRDISTAVIDRIIKIIIQEN